MRVLIFQHVPFEPPGCLLDWAIEKGYEISITRFFESGYKLPDTMPDLLIVMGGPMGVYDDLPWLEEEKAFIHTAIARGVRVLGICLGAQLIAHVLGAKVYPHTHKEIGWWPVSLTNAGQYHPLFSHFPQELDVLHWHGDTFDLPDEASLVFTSAACKHQAFINEKGNAIGLQFHIEADEQMVKGFTQHDQAALLKSSDWVQSTDEILIDKSEVIARNRRLLIRVMEEWVRQPMGN
jgi:GMP synthase-like glutamine amidotransferase